jgi:dihydropteroate synthase-like protein
LPHYHFVTGKLAEHALRALVSELAPRVGFGYSIQVLNITVAALMSPEWVARRIEVPPETDRVILPGYCAGDLSPVEQAARVPVERGPRDLRRLPEHFGEQPRREGYGAYDIEILAEINHAPRLALTEVLKLARRYADEGADLIDVGCDPGDTWAGVTETVQALKEQGYRISIDSMNPREIEPAVRAGAELVLSVNRSNREAAQDWGCEVVAIPDSPSELNTLDETIDYLAGRGVRLRLDPVLEPIGFGFAASLGRYIDVRRKYPDAEMMMGIGNLTELTDADSAAINVLLLGFCQELGIRSVLTTEVIHWAHSSVRECDLARRLAYHAVEHHVLPKHIEPGLVPLRGDKPIDVGSNELDRLAAEIKDNNYRLFADSGQLHVVGADMHLSGNDPFQLFEQLLARDPKNFDAGHAFYLGYELAKAITALTLDKEYQQDEALNWGYLTRPETYHRLKRQPRD